MDAFPTVKASLSHNEVHECIQMKGCNDKKKTKKKHEKMTGDGVSGMTQNVALTLAP